MHTGIATTSVGRRSITLALLKGQLKPADIKSDATADKWKVFRDICEARTLLGVTDRALSVLNALLSFHPSQQLDGAKDLIVFPSNAQLTLRAHGITGTTLRRHLAVLIDCGLIARKDSPNGKRYAHRDRSGKIEDAFGFSLAPLLTRAVEFSQMAEQVAADRKALRIAKERLSICRRDIRRLLAAAIDEGVSGEWLPLGNRLTAILARLPKIAGIATILETIIECDALREVVVNQLETQLNSPISDANDVQNERHLQNTNTYTIIESESSISKNAALETTAEHQPASRLSKTLSLDLVLRACPQIQDYAQGGFVSNWRDLMTAATVVRLMLGVSQAAYEMACGSMGAQNAAVAMACILERGGLIHSAGGYLRDLARRNENGGFSLEPMLMALLRTRSSGLQSHAA